MAYVVCEPCAGCKYTDCVEVCPCECFHHDDKMVYIDPDKCIDCAACMSACPVEAIYSEEDVPEEWQHYIELNATKASELPAITEMQEPLADS